MSADYTKEQHEKLIEWVRQAIDQDKKLREKHQVDDKFRFIRERLLALLHQLEQHPILVTKTEAQIGYQLMSDEILVYVYLYNAQGIQLRSWQNMLTPKVFYEYSVNRPIYREQADIEALLRSKSNKMQHAYLTVAVKPSDVIQQESVKDAIGQPMIRVKEGALRFEKLVLLTHNHIEYWVNKEGELIKKV